MDSKIVQVALSGLENILRVGKQEGHQMDGVNQFAVMAVSYTHLTLPTNREV